MDGRPLPHVPLNPLRPFGAAGTDVVFWLHAHPTGGGGDGGDPALTLDISGDGFALAGLPLDLDTAVPELGADFAQVRPRRAARDLAAPSLQVKLREVGRELQQRVVDAIGAALRQVEAQPDADADSKRRFDAACQTTHRKLNRYFAAATERYTRRLVIVAEPECMADDTPWEALSWGRDGQPSNPAIANGSVQLVRCVAEAEPGDVVRIDGPLRVLVLVGSLEQGERQDSCPTVPADVVQQLQAHVRSIEPSVALTVAVTQGSLGGLQSDVPLASLAEVCNLLAADPGWHVVHLIAHGRVDDSAGRGGAVFTLRLPNAEPHDLAQRASGQASELVDVALTTADLQRALGKTPVRVLVLSACDSGGAVASALLACADHVVAIATKVNPAWFAPAAKGLYRALAATRSLGEAVQEARAAIPSFPARSTLQHWARTLDARPLVDALSLREAHYRRFCALSHRSLFGPMIADLTLDRDDLLGDLFVELQLDDARAARSEKARVQGLADPLRAEHARDARRDPDADADPRAPLHEIVLRTHRRWVVLADPGAGKTTTLRQLARRFARGSERLPVYLQLSRWHPRADGRMPTLDEQLEALRPGLAEVFRAADQRKRALLLLDGIDEYGDAARLRELLDWLHVEVQSTIVLTSRWVGYRAQAVPPEFWRLRILSLNDPQLDGRVLKRQLLRRWFTARGAEHPHERAEATLGKLTGALHTFTDTPLLLHLVAWLDERGKRLATMRHEVYADIITAVVAGEHREGRGEAGSPLPEVARGALRALAAWLARHGQVYATRNELCRVLRGEGHPRAAAFVAEVQAWHREPHQALEALGRETGLVRPRDGFATADAEWGFWIKPFQDALVAEHLFHEVYGPARNAAAGKTKAPDLSSEQAGQRAVVAFLLSADSGHADQRAEFYGEAVALLTGHVPPPARNGWVRELLANRDLALQGAGVRAIAYLGEVGEGVMEAALKGMPEAEERARFYARLVEMAGERSGAARLLATCARTSPRRPWRDLYEIDTALMQLRESALGEQDQAGAEAAASARAELLGSLGERDSAKLRAAFAHLPDGAETWREIEPGWYQRGSPEGEGHGDERPAMPVQISKGFVIGATTITQEQYALFDPNYKPRWKGEHLPATEITWHAATMFARWLGRHLGVEGRLPTEAEWEYACRAQRCADAEAVQRASWPPFWCGTQLREDAACHGKGHEGHPRAAHVGQANAFGLRNVHGNVWEWCADWFAGYQADEDSVVKDPVGPRSGSQRVLRGGSYWNVADNCRSAYRNDFDPVIDYGFIGFRVVLSSPPTR